MQDILKKCLNSTGVSIDSRTVRSGNFFVALRGPTVNGNAFAMDAIKKGAAYALIDDERYQVNNQCILVDNALVTLQKMATIHRQKLKDITLIVVAGSNGKTTTKELIYAVLSTKYKAYRSYENFNNHIGVPVNLLNLTTEMDIAVIEIGANHRQEHDALCHMCQPNVAVVTNCGKDHLEGYGSEDGVIQSNKEVYDYLRQYGGHAFVNAEDSLLYRISEGVDRTFYGRSDILSTNVYADVLNQYPTLSLNVSNSNTTWPVKTNLYGDFQKDNILAALSMGAYFGVEGSKMKLAIESYKPLNNRSQKMKWRGNTLWMDAYNANPNSMIAMIDFFDLVPSEKKIIVLGGMREMGLASNSEHQAILERLKQVHCHQIYLVGSEYGDAKQRLNCIQFDTTKDLALHLNRQTYHGFDILVKGSRGFALEKAFTET